MWPWVIVEWATLLGILPAYLLWYPLQQPSGILAVMVIIVLMAKKATCLYVLHKRMKQIEEKRRRLQPAFLYSICKQLPS